ncbi:glycosyltransferase [Desulfosoma caldarium]|uniref:Glycosyl transferase family 2 n=1 Tax=Desulfosoma caldarium TaxID=610254 RepID=A0A3N1UHN5_9BACT|nr:glycosyltransferase [Desulfosoma caldarium]ROQ90772.1 glycosyl transferase family 2 [Desulfosoma caldarium]
MGFAYRIYSGGLSAELAVLQLSEVVDHLRNHLGNFLLDPTICSVYLQRLLKTNQEKATSNVRLWTLYLIRRMVEMSPFNPYAARLAEQVGLSIPHLKDLLKCTLPPNAAPKLASLLSTPNLNAARSGLLDLIRRYPYAVELIEPLLRMEVDLEVPVGSEWAEMIRLPNGLKPLLRQSLFLHALMQRDINRADAFFRTLNLSQSGPYVLNHVAEFFAAQGLTQEALRTYERSNRLDPVQVPVTFRMEALANGLQSPKGDIRSPNAVCLYSYNKEDLLERTLQSLAKSNLGNARILVLLNGCTDNSQRRVEALKERLFRSRMSVISLPVNIGAPAARNWLLALPEVKNAQYVAFLDDDVEVPPNWLESLVGVLERHPQAGVVGVKVLTPGHPPRLQYLYRNVAVARSDLIRISLDVPNWNYDVGFYDVTRSTVNVMGCCHVFRREAVDAVQQFDIRFSPSQMDDIAHDLEMTLAGYQVFYHGLVGCIHHQMSGIGKSRQQIDPKKIGNVLGNDVKFSYLFSDRLDLLKNLNNTHIVPYIPLH